MEACQICEYATPDGLYLCTRCHHGFTALLGRITDTLETAQDTLANQGHFGHGEGGVGTRDGAPAPINLDMSERLGAYRRRVVELASWTNATFEPDNPRIFTTPQIAGRYMHANTNALRKHPQVGDMYSELWNLERRVLSAADRPLVKRPLGECGALELTETGGVTACTGTIMGHETATTGRCDTCHREHDVTQQVANKITEAWHHLAPLSVVVKALTAAGHPIKYATARKWVERGKLHPRCDINTRQEGHTVAEVYAVMKTNATSSV